VFYGPGRRYGRTGADVAGEAFAGYGAVPKMLPVPGTGNEVEDRTGGKSHQRRSPRGRRQDKRGRMTQDTPLPWLADVAVAKCGE